MHGISLVSKSQPLERTKQSIIFTYIRGLGRHHTTLQRAITKQRCLLIFSSLKLNPQSSQTLQPTSPQTFFLLHSPLTLSFKTLLFQTGPKLSTFTLTSSKPQTLHSQPHTLFSSSPQHFCTNLLCQISQSLPLKHTQINKTVKSHHTVTSVSLWTFPPPT